MTSNPHPIGQRPLLVALLVGAFLLTRDLLAGVCVCILALLVFWWMQI